MRQGQCSPIRHEEWPRASTALTRLCKLTLYIQQRAQCRNTQHPAPVFVNTDMTREVDADLGPESATFHCVALYTCIELRPGTLKSAWQLLAYWPCQWRVWPLLILSSNFHVCNGRADGTQETNGHKYFLLFLLTEGQLRETESRAQAGRVKT